MGGRLAPRSFLAALVLVAAATPALATETDRDALCAGDPGAGACFVGESRGNGRFSGCEDNTWSAGTNELRAWAGSAALAVDARRFCVDDNTTTRDRHFEGSDVTATLTVLGLEAGAGWSQSTSNGEVEASSCVMHASLAGSRSEFDCPVAPPVLPYGAIPPPPP